MLFHQGNGFIGDFIIHQSPAAQRERHLWGPVGHIYRRFQFWRLSSRGKGLKDFAGHVLHCHRVRLWDLKEGQMIVFFSHSFRPPCDLVNVVGDLRMSVILIRRHAFSSGALFLEIRFLFCCWSHSATDKHSHSVTVATWAVWIWVSTLSVFVFLLDKCHKKLRLPDSHVLPCPGWLPISYRLHWSP